MKVLLINPPYRRFLNLQTHIFPIGLGYIATILKNQGIDVLIYDMEINPLGGRIDSFYDNFLESRFILDRISNKEHSVYSELIEVLNYFNPDIVGITILTNKLYSAIETAKIVKKFNKKIIICAGGVHPNIVLEDFDNFMIFDHIFSGEGELIFPKFVNDKINKKKLNRNYIEKNSVDIDLIDFPKRDFIYKKNSIDSGYYSGMLISRGCPYNCKYCNSSQIWRDKKVRFRKIRNIINELIYLKTEYNITHFNLCDDNLFLNKNFLFNLCDEIIKANLKLTWQGQCRLNLIDEETLSKLISAGCNDIMIGIESGSKSMQKKINKNIELNAIEKKIKIINKLNMNWGGYFIMGFPDETLEEMEQTYNLLKILNPGYGELNLFNLLPKTAYYQKLNKKIKINWSAHSQENLNNYIFCGMEKKLYQDTILKYAKLFDEHNKSNSKNVYENKYNFAKKNGFILDTAVIYNYASILEDKGDYEKSMELFKSILKSKFNIGGIYFHLGNINIKLNNIEVAKKYLSECLKIIPEHKKALTLFKGVRHL